MGNRTIRGSGAGLQALVIGLLVFGLAGPTRAQGQAAKNPPPKDAAQPAAADAKADAAAPTEPGKSELSEKELKELQGNVDEAKVGPEVFDEGVKDYYDGKYVDAAKRLWDYLAGNPPGAKSFGYAEHFLALSLDRLGFSHAAIEYYYNVAKNRTKPELLPDALEAIERITREKPYDQELVLKDLLYDTTFGYMREDLRQFIEYYRGLQDYRNGFIKWGERHFSTLPKDNYYYFKARYVQAVYELVKFNLEEALKIFQEILTSDIQQVDVINSSRQSVARILYEQKKYKEAYAMYERIDAPVEHQAPVFMEEAWSQYFMKDYRRAMGLLYALEAPAYYRFFNPEKYLIKSLIYKNLCHYNVAKDAVDEFRQYYGEALTAVYDRVDMEKNQVLMDAALQDPSMVDVSKFARLLDTEQGRLLDYEAAWRTNGLLDHLTRLYNLKIQETNRRLKTRLDAAIRTVAETLLEYEEQMNLLEYEIGLSIYKRVKGTPTQKEIARQEIPRSGKQVYYEFDGEFWNDELHDFRFFIEDRCYSEERWE